MNAKLANLIRANRTRIDYAEKFRELIEAYNRGTRNIEEFFKELVKFAQELEEEEKRAVAENLNEEELALFDILTKPEMDLTVKDRNQVKKAARTLLETLKK